MCSGTSDSVVAVGGDERDGRQLKGVGVGIPLQVCSTYICIGHILRRRGHIGRNAGRYDDTQVGSTSVLAAGRLLLDGQVMRCK